MRRVRLALFAALVAATSFAATKSHGLFQDAVSGDVSELISVLCGVEGCSVVLTGRLEELPMLRGEISEHRLGVHGILPSGDPSN